ncbi:MAG: hypothetical protein RLZ55_1060, partial [Actinomycetota bacterium]
PDDKGLLGDVAAALEVPWRSDS